MLMQPHDTIWQQRTYVHCAKNEVFHEGFVQ